MSDQIPLDQVAEVEVLDHPTVADLTPARLEHGALVRPAAPVSEVLDAFREYTELVARITDRSDYQRIGSKDFPKRAALRKLGTAFGVSYAILDRQIERDGRRTVYAEFLVRATAPGGRYSDGWGACDVNEKCERHRANCPEKCTKHCGGPEAGCDGRQHFSKPEHDIPATAETRAKNRAAAELFAMGAVSAEEVDRQDASVRQATPDDLRAVTNAARRLKDAGGDPGHWPVVLGVTVLVEDPETGEKYPPITSAEASALVARLHAGEEALRSERMLGDENAGEARTGNDGNPASVTDAEAVVSTSPAPSSEDYGPAAAAAPAGPALEPAPAPDAAPLAAAPEPEPIPAPSGEPVRKGQTNRMGALATDLGMTREARLALASFIAQRAVTSAKELTEEEAEWLITAMRLIRDGHVAIEQAPDAWGGVTLGALDPTDGMADPATLRGVVWLKSFAQWHGLEFSTEEG